MSRLRITPWENAQRTVDDLYADMERRISAAPCGNCPVELTSAFLKLCLAQSCGKCVPCRIGLDRLADLLDRLLDGQGSQEDLETILRTAHTIVDSADCAIGFEAAQMVLDGYVAFQDDYLAHVTQGSCTANFKSVPCVELCPAHVDAPGYISLVGEGRYADAIRLIRKDNPFPSVCALVCEHPCESHCRRTIVDSPLNIRGIKRFAVDNAGEVPVPPRAPETGKKIAVIGGGPSGLTAAYFLSLMGHRVKVFERKPKLGDMLMEHFLDDDYDPKYPEMIAGLRSEEYYVNMMIAWYFATALAKQYESILPYIEQKRLDDWTHNKAIQKSLESRRIGDEQKLYLKSLKAVR